MKRKVLKNVFVLGELCKMGTEVEIENKNLGYYEGVIEKAEEKKPKKKKAGDK